MVKFIELPIEDIKEGMIVGKSIDMDVLRCFMKVLILYPVDSIVELSNGETVRVIRGNKGLALRPVVVGIDSGNVYDLSAKQCAGLVIV